MILISVISSLMLSRPAQAAQNLRHQIIAWNVGQGQWITSSRANLCEHFDLGGEFAPWTLIQRECGAKLNRAHFSHWDWDHIGLATLASRRLKKFCVADWPRGPAPTSGKEKILALPKCETEANTNRAAPLQIYWKDSKPMDQLSSNDLSRIFISDNTLIPGDSTQIEEKEWIPELARIPSARAEIKILILGHHGSRSSTSLDLLDHLPHLRAAISSARHSRYGHPHALVVSRLRLRHIPLLKTEDWGTIRFEE